MNLSSSIVTWTQISFRAHRFEIFLRLSGSLWNRFHFCLCCHWYCSSFRSDRSDKGALFPNASIKLWVLCCSREEIFFGTHRRLVEIKKKTQSRLIFSKSTTHYSGNTNEGEKEEDIAKMTLIWRAIKLPIYSVALVPLTVRIKFI